MTTVVQVGDELWVGLPPGWIELVAHQDEAAAQQWFDELLRTAPAEMPVEVRQALREHYASVREQMPRGTIDSAGLLVTTLPDDTVTAWQFAMTIVAGPPIGDVDLLAVVERFLDSPAGSAGVGPEDLVESFVTHDGRPGVAIHTTTGGSDALRRNVPHANADALGVVYAAVRLEHGRADSDRVLLLTGIAPTVAERLPMSVLAAQIVLSATLRDSGDRPDVRVALDTTGQTKQDSTRP
ncbi:hypothetical protein ACIPEP_01250 [Curtobacterium sp. NPDC087082]|uniref:hypothetical protein n=1 Tax=Curtobacterium sp. NPDC087082 TaxID=3363966 RepID=UPI0037FD8F8A